MGGAGLSMATGGAGFNSQRLGAGRNVARGRTTIEAAWGRLPTRRRLTPAPPRGPADTRTGHHVQFWVFTSCVFSILRRRPRTNVRSAHPTPETAAAESYWKLTPQQERRRLAAVVLAGFCAFLDLYAPQPMLPMLSRVFHASAGGISLLVTVSTAAVALTAPWIGLLADRLGHKRVIVPSAILLAAPTMLAASSGTLGQLLFWRFWQGVFTPGIFVATVAYIADEWEGPTGAAIAAYVAGTVVGGFAGRTAAAFIAHWSNWQAAFIALGALNLAGGVAIWAWLPRGSRRENRSNEPLLGHDADAPAKPPTDRHLCRRVLRAVHAPGHIHLRQFLFGCAAFQSAHRPAWNDLRGVPARRGSHHHWRTLHRPFRPPPRAAAGGCRRSGRHPADAGAERACRRRRVNARLLRHFPFAVPAPVRISARSRREAAPRRSVST